MKSEKLELLSVEISPPQAKSFLVVCWYRPPTSGVDEESFENLRDTLRQLDKEEKEIILIGDTNCDIASKQNSNTKRLKAIYSEYQLEQLVKSYTRVSITTNENNEQRTSKTLIDHFSTTRKQYISEVDVLEVGMVDHYLVYGVRKIGNQRLRNKKPKIIFIFIHFHLILFKHKIHSVEYDTKRK